ncbi:acyl-CoA dehydrogenase family protein [Frankia sp. CNm7]|uniref:Acyl-[acyl-carrier-protein] dehydrogenase MbtN n=1 Tax=Frankia nepalensis TaxID=1836974 RepID=A0A937RMG6_9ACTN|nr:acyl-CoA dehydrogenase family protein [Frankia nepalensis]MBL7500631.1 acyl-CoA dehydrogenase family protein [Frankia nepalensis]MBL7511408.1 acyl-CoA dehydrogenase family protein [Frankia nepalensis]MBL7521759.1 acyl-CoA dehydrogenase family protein [Frankia nepalensis]MBL7631504.1 acyl-CoA dehydrogenase family protein [Frankia nepalensis]
MSSVFATRRALYDDEHEHFRATVRAFVDKHAKPNAERWRAEGKVDRWLFEEAAGVGILGFNIPEEYGGGGTRDFRFNAIVTEELGRNPVSDGLAGIGLSNDIVIPYFTDLADDEQKARWLPGIASGELVVAVAMTEPGTGSDLAGIRTSAVRHGEHYVVNGSKVFISNGQNADLVVTAVRTGEDPHRGLSLLVVEADTPGFGRGRNLEKIGLHAQDTSELFFDDLRVPVTNLLGEEGSGFAGLMRNLPQERLTIAAGAVAAAEGVLERTVAYVTGRKAFGKPVSSFQNTRFELAEMVTATRVSRVYVDDLIARHTRGEVTAAEAAAAKFWTTEQLVDIVGRCLQLHGGYGYMAEYRIAHDFVDARITTIYGGTTEIMKEIVGRDLGL